MSTLHCAVRPRRTATSPRLVELPAELDQWVNEFDGHLSQVAGLATATRRQYCFFVRRFLAQYRDVVVPERCVLRAEWLTDFARQEATRLHGPSRNKPGTSLRSWLRYLVFCGVIDAGMEAAIPSMPQWRYASLPVRLTANETERVINASRDGGSHELRNRAILLLLARLGLRACEARHLTLDDIDWDDGSVRIAPGKNRCERRLPLPHDVGDALYVYLRDERPACSCREVFLSTRKPYGPIRDSSLVSGTVRQAMKRCGISSMPAAAHALRHSAATRMVCRGASFKDVADVLGHASIKTTGIYAKLDVAALAHVALPWPGVTS